jgi:hypothetical protein
MGGRYLQVSWVLWLLYIHDAKSWEEDTYRYHGYYGYYTSMTPNHGRKILTGIMGIMVIIHP